MAIKASGENENMTSRIYERGLERFHLEAKDKEIKEGEVYFISSGLEVAYNNLIINGYLRVDGLLTVKGELTINGTLNVNGEVEIGNRW